MSTSSVLLHQCACCSSSFKEADGPVLSNSCVVTACFHTFHQNCLGEWVTRAENVCPLCRKPCYQHQAGKDFTIIWKIFTKVLSISPSIALEVLQSTVGETESCCSACTDDFPLIPVYFDREAKRLVHDKCSSSDTKALLTLDIISRVVQKYAEKDAALAEILTPTPPSFYERVRRNHPAVFKKGFSGLFSDLVSNVSRSSSSMDNSSAPSSSSNSSSSTSLSNSYSSMQDN